VRQGIPDTLINFLLFLGIKDGMPLGLKLFGDPPAVIVMLRTEPQW
jgi:hypothetical protein